MSSIVWPTRFPSPNLSNFRTRPGNALLRTNMESGPARQRRQSTQMPALIDAEWRVNRQTFTLIESWFKHYLHDGAEWFSIELWSGYTMIAHRVRFIAPYNAQVLSPMMIVIKGELEVDNPPVMAKVTLDNYLAT